MITATAIRVQRLAARIDPRWVAIGLFVALLVLGIIIFPDYGISTDEATERRTTIAHYVYVMGPFLRRSGDEFVRYFATHADSLHEFPQRYYGVFLQALTLGVEHLFGFRIPSREIYLMRHLFTYLNFWAAGVFFYLLLRRRFPVRKWLPIVGALLYFLYPRFFAESFYNIKDLLFYSWTVIAVYFALRWVEQRRSKLWIPAAISIAIATNTRILGVAVLLLTMVAAVVYDLWISPAFDAKPGWRVARRPIGLAAATGAVYLAITPFLWANPPRNAARMFIHFLRFPGWGGLHFFRGEWITAEVPWYYIPAWIAITSPTLYLALFVVGLIATTTVVVVATRALYAAARTSGRAILNDDGTLGNNTASTFRSLSQNALLYDAYFLLLFTATLAGFILLRIEVYNGWRHIYFVFLPILYLAVRGLGSINSWITRLALNTTVTRLALPAWGICVALAMTVTGAWMIRNHPFQFAYFNPLARQSVRCRFDLDYWGVSQTNLLRVALAMTPEAQVTVFPDVSLRAIMLTDAERERMRFTNDVAEADWLVQGDDPACDWLIPPAGFEPLIVIEVDGMVLSRLHIRATA